MSAALSQDERERIEREARHAQGTRWPEGDSWVQGYAEDVPKLLAEIDRLHAGISDLLAMYAPEEDE